MVKIKHGFDVVSPVNQSFNIKRHFITKEAVQKIKGDIDTKSNKTSAARPSSEIKFKNA